MRLRLIVTVTASALLAFGQKADRSKPPETPPLAAYKLPPTYESKLPNGLSIVLVEDQRFPLVTVRLAFSAGLKYDPKPMPGLSENVSALLTQGTKTRTSRQLAEELASIGGALNGQATPDALILAGSSLSENGGHFLELLADVARNANFPDQEVQIYKQNRKQELLAQRSTPNFLADEKLAAVVYGSHPYSHIAPTPEALDTLDAAVLTKFQDSYLVPNNAILIFLGKLPPRAETLKLIESRFGDWQRKEVPAQPTAAFPEAKREIILVDRPGSVQADIHLGKLAVTQSNPDYFPMAVGNTILGAGASSRLFNTIREAKGYAYDVHSVMQPRKDTGLFSAVTQVRNEVMGPALEALLAELDRMGKERVTTEELSNVKNFMSGFFVMRLETQNGLASQLSQVKIMGLPNDYLEKYTSRVRSVEPDEIQTVARKYIVPENSPIVVVGDAAQIQKALEKFGEVKVTKAE